MKKILIIGAGFLQNFVIQEAKRLGYYVIAVDGNKNAVGFKSADKFATIDIIDEQKCLEFAKDEKINGVVTAATDYGVLTSAYIAEKMNLPGLNYKAAKLIKNKYLVRKKLYENNVDDTDQFYEINKNTNLIDLSKKISFPVIVKPSDGSGSRGISRIDSTKTLEQSCVNAMEYSINGTAEMESFIEGKEYGVESFVYNNEIRVLGIMKKWMTEPPYYAELGHAIPSGLPEYIENKIVNYVKKAIQTLGINFGSVNMDILVTDAGKIHIIDVGARMGGNMIGPCLIPYGTGINYISNLIKSAVGDPIDWSVRDKNAVVSKILAFAGGKVTRLPNFENIVDENVEIYHKIEINQMINEYHTNLDGSGYIIVKDKEINSAIKSANEIYKSIEDTIFERTSDD